MKREFLLHCAVCGALQSYVRGPGAGPSRCPICGDDAPTVRAILWRGDCPEGWTAHAWSAHRRGDHPAAAILARMAETPQSQSGVWALKGAEVGDIAPEAWTRIGGVTRGIEGGVEIRLMHAPPAVLPPMDGGDLRKRWGDWLDAGGGDLALLTAAWPGPEALKVAELLEQSGERLSLPERCVLREALIERGVSISEDVLGLLDIPEEIVAWMIGGAFDIPTPETATRLLGLASFPFETPLRERCRRWTYGFRSAVREAWARVRPPTEGAIPAGDGPLDQRLRAAGFEHWRSPEQRAATHLVFDGRDGIVVLPTGSGKTLCYALAARALAEAGEGYTLVISPLLALMADQVARESGAVRIRGGMTALAQNDALDALAEGAPLLFASPEILLRGTFRERLRDADLLPARIVVDEAHCVLEWGEGFRPDFQRIGDLRAWFSHYAPAPIPLTAFTATLDLEDVDRLAEVLHLSDPETLRGPSDRPELRWACEVLQHDSERLAWLDVFLRERAETRGIVYTTFKTRNAALGAESIAQALVTQGFQAAAYTGSLKDPQRAALAERLRSGDISVLVATSAFGMGVDLPYLDWVVHIQPPLTLKSYVQGAGRAGRGMDGRVEQARCVLLGHRGDKARYSQHLYGTLPTEAKLSEMIETFRHQMDLTRHYRYAPETDRIAIDPQREPATAGALAYAARHDALTRLPRAEAQRDDGWQVYQLPEDPDALPRYGRIRETQKARVDARWHEVMVYLEGNPCRRERLLERVKEAPERGYRVCCDRCDAVK